MSKWIRQIHRWLAIPLVLAVVVSLIWSATQGATVPLPACIGGIGIVSLLTLFLTGLVMFVQHYWAKWRRGQRNKSSYTVTKESAA